MFKSLLFLSCIGLSSATKIVELIQTDDRFSKLKELLADDKYSDVVDALSSDGNFTLFAPNNDAFDTPPAADDILNTLYYHTLGVEVGSTAIKDTPTFVNTLLTDPTIVFRNDDKGQLLKAQVVGSDVMINEQKVTVPDVTADNGVIHIVDGFFDLPKKTSAIAEGATPTLYSLIGDNDLVSLVDTTKSITIFAPTDAAFTAAGAIDADAVPKVLENHVVAGTVFSTDLQDGQLIQTLGDAYLKVSIVNDKYYIDGAEINLESINIISQNAVIHVMSNVILSKNVAERVVADSDLSTLTSVVTSDDYKPVADLLADETKKFTLFAPTNQAFTDANVDTSDVDTVTAVLQYHLFVSTVVQASDITDVPAFIQTALTNEKFVTKGDDGQVITAVIKDAKAMINDAEVVGANIGCQNGIIHKINKVLMPPGLTSDIAQGAGLTTLVDSVTAADLVGVVNESPSITIFAPTNDAFGKVTIADDLVDGVLKSHVVTGGIKYSTDLTEPQEIETASGHKITVTVVDGVVMVDNAKVTVANVITKNAVVHVIDGVLNVPSTSGTSIAKPLFSSVLLALGAHNFLGF